MKFYCDSCNTKYGIADEKVRGKVLKVRCKKCGNVITVREQSVPVTQASAATTVPPAAPSVAAFDARRVQWHYSINGQSFGPFTFDKLERRFISGELGDECYVWTDSFSSWKPVRQVDAFTEALAQSQQIKPRTKTVGVSEGLEAIDPEKLRAAKQAKQTKQERSKSTQPEPAQPEPVEPEPVQPEPVEPEAAQPESDRDNRAQEDGQKDRLAKLRARLKAKSDAPEEDDDSPSFGDDLAADGGSAQLASVDQEEEKAGPDVDEPGEATVPMDADKIGAPDDPFRTTVGLDEPSQESNDGESSGLFADLDLSEPAVGPAASEPGAQDSDHIPFLAGAPELESETGRAERKKQEADGITGSLLIQLDNIQKEGRGKKTLMVVAALLVIGGLVATAIYLAGQVEPAKEVVQKKSSDDEDDDELVIRKYSADERSKILVLGNQHVGSEKDEAAAPKEAEKEEPTKVAANQAKGTSEKRVRGPKIKDNNAAMDKAFETATKKGSADEGLRKTIDDGSISSTAMKSPLAGKSDAFKGLSALQSDRQDPIYNPTDSLKGRKKAAGGNLKLTRQQINQGMRTVRRSVGLCRQRHSRRGAPLDARKIYLTITVEPSGSVSAFSLDPERVRHTEFDKCMNSHRGRWRFPSFDGTAQQMRAPFVLE